MSQVPSPSPLTDLADAAEPVPTLVRPIPGLPEPEPITDFELEVRRRLADIEAHVTRNDGLILGCQVETRRLARGIEARIEKRFDELKHDIAKVGKEIADVAPLLRRLVGNGHG